jgi:hypothetical protein
MYERDGVSLKSTSRPLCRNLLGEPASARLSLLTSVPERPNMKPLVVLAGPTIAGPAAVQIAVLAAPTIVVLVAQAIVELVDPTIAVSAAHATVEPAAVPIAVPEAQHKAMPAQAVASHTHSENPHTSPSLQTPTLIHPYF